MGAKAAGAPPKIRNAKPETSPTGGKGQTLTSSATVSGPEPIPKNIGPFSPDEYKELESILAPLREAWATGERPAMKSETTKALSGLRFFEAKLTRAARIEAALAVREITARVEKGEVPGTAEHAEGSCAMDAMDAKDAKGTAVGGGGEATPGIASKLAPTGPLSSATKGMPFVPIKARRCCFVYGRRG